MLRLLITLITPLIFLGCAPSTFQEMKSREDTKKMSFSVNENYEYFYKKSLQRAKECYEFGMITAAFIVDGQLYNNTKEAEISVSLMGGLGRSVHNGATIKGPNDNLTEVELFSYFGVSHLEKMKRIFTDDTYKCEK